MKPVSLFNPADKTTDKTPNVSWTAANNSGSPIVQYEIAFDVNSWWDPDGGAFAERQFFSEDTKLEESEFRTALSVGPWTWWVRAYDEAGNRGAWSNGKLIEIVEPKISRVAWQTLSGEDIADNTRVLVGDKVRLYVAADYAQVGDRFRVWVYEDDGVSFDDLITPNGVEIAILSSNGLSGTGSVEWAVPWNPDSNFASDLGVQDIYPEYRIWDTKSGWTWWPKDTHRSDLIEARGGTLPNDKWTVVSHGLQWHADETTYPDLVNPEESGAWMWQLANKIQRESINLSTGLSNIAIHTMEIVNGAIELWNQTETSKTKSTPRDIADATKHHILLYDWAELSDYQTDGEGDPRFRLVATYSPPPGSPSDDGFADASGDALYALIRQLGIADKIDTLIGHSRGAIVMSETARRLLASGATVDQVIYLDAEGGGNDRKFSDPAFGLYSDQAFHAWAETDTTDIYSDLNDGAVFDIIAMAVVRGVTHSDAAAIAAAVLIPDVDFGGHSLAGAAQYRSGAAVPAFSFSSICYSWCVRLPYWRALCFGLGHSWIICARREYSDRGSRDHRWTGPKRSCG